MPAEEIVTVAVEGAVGVVTLRVPALTRAAKEQLLAACGASPMTTRCARSC